MSSSELGRIKNGQSGLMKKFWLLLFAGLLCLRRLRKLLYSGGFAGRMLILLKGSSMTVFPISFHFEILTSACRCNQETGLYKV